MNIIVATDEKGGISKDGQIPWHCPEDQKFFRLLTIGDTVVMGSKTFESMGSKPLKVRKNIVLTTKNNQSVYSYDLAFYTFSNFVGDYCYDLGSESIWIIGGAQIYNMFLNGADYVNYIYRSVIKGDYNCDKFFEIPTGYTLLDSFKLSDQCTIEKYINAF